MTNNWANRLLSAMDERAKRQTDGHNAADLGTIQADGSLLMDQFSVAIPPEGFLIAEWDMSVPTSSRVVRLASPVDDTGEDLANTIYSEHTRIDFVDGNDSGHVVDVISRFAAGDRVLVFWVSGEPVIISKVVSGDSA